MQSIVRRRPYHAGSLLVPPVKQDVSEHDRAEWPRRVAAYWNRSNARAAEIARALVGFLGPEGELMPSLKTLAARVGCDVKTAHRWIKTFAEVGFLRVTRRRTLLFGQTSNSYEIRFPDPEAQADQPSPREHLAELPIYNQDEDSNGETSIGSLPPRSSRPAALRRLNAAIGSVYRAVCPAPQAPRYTAEQQIAILQGRFQLE